MVDFPRVPTSEWKWFGNAGHFICGQWCRFHLCTQIGDVLISTVGEYVHPRHSHGREQDEAAWLKANWPGEDIGFNRKYETMVFRCGKPCTLPECNCGLPELGSSELETRGYNARRDAIAGHMEMCAKWAATPAPAEQSA